MRASAVAVLARRDLGSRYLVWARPVSLPPAWEGVELTVTRPK